MKKYPKDVDPSLDRPVPPPPYQPFNEDTSVASPYQPRSGPGISRWRYLQDSSRCNLLGGINTGPEQLALEQSRAKWRVSHVTMY